MVLHGLGLGRLLVMTPTKRPAEWLTIFAGALTTVIAYATGITDAGVLQALPLLISFTPSVVTGLVEWWRSL